MSQAVRTVPCPTCGAAVRWESASQFRPFCSERCKMIDLGEWASETYRVPAQEESPDSEIDPSRYS